MAGAKFFAIVENAFNTINHILIGFITIYLTFICSQTSMNARSWHVLLCTFGYQLLMAEGIIALAPGNIWTYLVSRRTKILLHWLLQVIGAAFSIVGCWFEYKGRSANRHLNNKHELLGFVSIVFMCITIVNGLANLYNQELSRWIKPVFQKAIHNVLGIVTFVIGMVSIYYSYEFRWVKNLVPDAMRETLEILTIVTLVLSLFGALRAFYLQMKQILSKDA